MPNVLTYREALTKGIREALIDNDDCFLMGEDVGAYGGAYAVSKGLLEEFGPKRIVDSPLSESAIVGKSSVFIVVRLNFDLPHFKIRLELSSSKVT